MKILFINPPDENKVSENTVFSIVKDAVIIEKEFITKCLPCKLIGMISELLEHYIEELNLCFQNSFHHLIYH